MPLTKVAVCAVFTVAVIEQVDSTVIEAVAFTQRAAEVVGKPIKNKVATKHASIRPPTMYLSVKFLCMTFGIFTSLAVIIFEMLQVDYNAHGKK